jgi:hypothetical protein
LDINNTISQTRNNIDNQKEQISKIISQYISITAAIENALLSIESIVNLVGSKNDTSNGLSILNVKINSIRSSFKAINTSNINVERSCSELKIKTESLFDINEIIDSKIKSFRV